ncbi:hypothetical protein PIB30_011765 [Stylosanthes scabra]|uniref:Ribonuclease H1 N-terminal domain-containing protein n=1 Tax=Stylosanthes scabra TaxID=79078 RepID=A0ABU6Q6M0_9FABA|nr:hypothetical protein [Stylosanthes scabra]
MEEGKYSHYAVKVGRVASVYTSWGDCAPHVLGFPGAQFKGFKSLEEAMKYMQAGSHGKGKMVGSTSKVMEKLSLQMSTLRVGTSGMSPRQPFQGMSNESVPMGCLGDEEFVPRTQGGGFLIVENMEIYLLRACRKLEAGGPSFQRRVFYDTEGLKHYAFKAALRCEQKGIDVEVIAFSALTREELGRTLPTSC